MVSQLMVLHCAHGDDVRTPSECLKAFLGALQTTPCGDATIVTTRIVHISAALKQDRRLVLAASSDIRHACCVRLHAMLLG